MYLVTEARMTNTQSENTTNNCLEQALYYLEKLQWSIIPVGSNKAPLIDWKKYQTIKASREEVHQWFEKFPTVNIGVVTGKLSNLIGIDIDPRHGGTDKEFDRTITVTARTGGGGKHFYFLYEEGIQNHAGIKPGLDVRGEGGFLIIPPSKTESGEYHWLISPQSGTPITALPAFVKEWLNKGKTQDKGNNQKSNWDESVLNGVETGRRNEVAASVAGKLLKRFPKEEWESEAWPLFQGWNKNNKPPLPEDELRTVFDSIKKREIADSENNKESDKDTPIALQLVEDIKKENILFFHDEYKEGFAATKGDGREIFKLRSRLFRQYVARLVHKKSGRIISSDMLSNIIQLLEGKAVFEGPLHKLHIRIARQDNTIWYDLGNSSIVHIDKDGWNISDTSPILFRRYNHHLPQVAPQKGGNVHDLSNFVNLSEDKEKLLFLVYTVTAFIPGFPHPVLVFHGPGGAGKTTPLRLLKSLIDPSILKTLTAPDSLREFIQMAAHHYFFFLDNLSSLPDWLSDALARACTGDGFTKRELFSDDDDFIYEFQRIVALNGITLVVEKADLLDRAILLGLERIPKDKRRKEDEFWSTFDKVKPYILGAIFDTVVAAIKIYPTISLSSHPRMADFASWGCAIARALGYKDEEFLSAYNNNITQQNDAAIDASPVGTAVITYMSDREGWEGTATDLLTVLEEQAKELKINIKARKWPKDPSSLGRKIQLIQSNLAEKGIRVIRDEKARPRRMTILKIAENAVAPVGSDGGDKKALNQPTATDGKPSDGVGPSVGGNGLSEQSATGATPPSPFSEKSESYSDEELENPDQLEFEMEDGE